MTTMTLWNFINEKVNQFFLFVITKSPLFIKKMIHPPPFSVSLYPIPIHRQAGYRSVDIWESTWLNTKFYIDALYHLEPNDNNVINYRTKVHKMYTALFS